MESPAQDGDIFINIFSYVPSPSSFSQILNKTGLSPKFLHRICRFV